MIKSKIQNQTWSNCQPLVFPKSSKCPRQLGNLIFETQNVGSWNEFITKNFMLDNITTFSQDIQKATCTINNKTK